MTLKKIIIPLAIMLFWFPLTAGAIPALGVAPTTDGTYYGPYEEYLAYFADTFVNPFNGNAGFLIPESGGSLTLWYGGDSGSPDLTADIYLATDSQAGDDFIFDGMDFVNLNTSKQADGYKPANYFGVNLGPVADEQGALNVGWQQLNSQNWPGAWYVYSGIIEYHDFLGWQEDWLFAMADLNHSDTVFDESGDAFSPKTTSSAMVPEPTTLLLLGLGLIGLAGIRKH